MAPVTSLILYEQAPDTTFNMQYFLSTHMGLVQENWGEHGLTGWRVLHLTKGLQDSAPAFRVAVLLEWESAEAAEAAVSSEAAGKVFGDTPNYTDIKPLFMVGGEVGRG